MGKELLALGSVVVLVVRVTDGADRDGLDECASGQQVQDGPGHGGRPIGIAGEDLAPRRGGALLASSRVVVEREERDVGELQGGQVGQDGVRQLDVAGLGPVDRLSGRGDGGLIGGYSAARPC